MRSQTPPAGGSSTGAEAAGRFRAEEGLREKEEHFRQLVAGVRDYAVFLLDRQGNVLTWNAGAERIKGYRAEEIVGKHFSTFYPADTVSSGWPAHELDVAAATGRFEDEGWRLRKDGSRFWASVVITALRDEGGGVRGFLKITRDMTDRKQAEEKLRRSEERFRLIVEQVKDYAIFMLDPAGHVATWNAGAERLKGYAADEIIGKHFSTFYPEEAVSRGWPDEELRRAVADGRLEDEGWRLRKDGSRFWANVVITALRDDAGVLRGFAKVTRDLTERREAEESARRLLQEEAARKAAEAASQEIERQREQLHVTLASIGDAVIVTDAGGAVTFMNRVACGLTGWEPEEAAGQLLEQVLRIINEETRQPVENPVSRVIREGRVVELANHTALVARDGREVPIEDTAAPIRGKDDTLSGVVLVFRDVTEARRAAEARQRLAAIVESSHDAIIGHTPDGLITSWNRGAERLYGYAADEVVGRPLSILVPADLPDEMPAVTERIRKGEHIELFETQRVRKDGGRVDVSLTISPIRDAEGRVIGASKIARDVTESKRAERALRAVEARFAAVINHAPACVFAKDREGRYLLANRSLTELVGRGPKDFLGRTDYDFFPPEVAEQFARDDAAVIDSGRPRTYEESFPHGGVTRTYLTVKFPLRDEAGAAYAACAVATEISDLKRAQEALRATADRLNLALAAARLGDWSWDAATDVVTLSDRAAEVFGIPPDPHPTWSRLQELLHEEDRDRARLRVEEAVAGRTPYDVEYRVRRPDEAHAWVAAQGRAHYGPDGRPLGMYGVVQDITARKEAEEALREEARTTETLYRVGRVLAAELDLRPIVQTVTDEATSLTGAQFGAFFYNMPNDRNGSYTLHTISGVPREAFDRLPMPRNTQIFEPTFRGLGVVRLGDVTQDARYGQNAPYHGMPEGHLPVRSYLAVPVVSRSGEVIGGLFFGHAQPGVFTERHERLVVGVAAQAAVAIDNARLYGRLRESEGRFRLLTDALPVLISYVDADQRYRLVNRQYEVWFGHPRDRIQGQAVREVIGEAAHAAVREHVEAALAGRETTFEQLIPYRDAGTRFVRATYVPHVEGGTVHGFYSLVSDVTASKRAEQDARFLADASAALAGLVDFESTLQKVARLAVPHFADWCAVDVLDRDDTLRRVAVAHTDPSKVELAYELYSRFPPDPASPQGVWNVIRTGRSDMIPEISDDVLAATVEDADLLRILRGLGLRSYMGVPLKVRARVLGVITFVAAESDRKYGPADLAVAEDLAHRAAVAVENARLYHEVREADRRKDEFLAVLGHELRNPLAPISNALQVLKSSRADGRVVGQAREMMERQVQHMVRLVDDLLDVSRIVRGKVELRREPVELAGVVARAVEAAQPLVEAERHDLTVDLPPDPLLVYGDPVRLAQVVGNLLNNAARYTERGGRITVEGRREGDRAVLRVRDTGVGIAPEALTRIWDMFVQADRRMRAAQGGMGIGLALVKGLVEMHGGTVGVRSEGLGRGSEFTVALPLLSPVRPDGEPGQEQAGSRQAEPRRVLVVDDNVDAAESLALLLRLGGHEVRVAHDGPTALELARTDPPEVAFFDIGMPVIDGYELARRFKSQPALRDVFLVALTGWGQEEDRRRTREAGFDAHEVKPVTPEALDGLLAGRGQRG